MTISYKSKPAPADQTPAHVSVKLTKPDAFVDHPDRLIGTAIVCVLLGVNRQTLGKYLKREDFPKGLYLPNSSKMSWRLQDILNWGKASLTDGPTFEKTKFLPKVLL